MKVLILSVADLRHMTCCNYYYNFLEKNKINFDVICTNRYKEKSKMAFNCNNLYQYDMIIADDTSKIGKIKYFLGFKKYANNLIKKNKYDFIIVWGENAFILFRKTLKKYGDCVLYNMRDYLEGLSKLYNHAYHKLMKYTLMNTCPSPKCMDSLRGRKYVLTNRDAFVEKFYPREKKFHKASGDRIVITYLGLITKYADEFKRFILPFKGDNRFELRFYGTGAFVCLKDFIEENSINNVVLGDTFTPDKTTLYLGETDIINSVYGVSNSGVKDAVGVKESYSPLLHIPILSDKGCHWATLSEKYKFGFGVNEDFSFAPNEIFEWYNNINSDEFDNGCDEYCKEVYKNNEVIENILYNKLMEMSK